MAKESCWNCSTRLTAPAAFCPECGQPTRHATDADRLDFDLRQWRSHVERNASGKEAAAVSGSSPRAGVATAIREERFVAPPPEEKKARRVRPSAVRLRMPKLPLRQRDENAGSGERVIDLTDDDPFAYRACVTCGEVDWILRGNRNDDGTFNYWCLRCSRAFKTSVRLSHGPKPFIAAGIVVAVLATFLYLLR